MNECRIDGCPKPIKVKKFQLCTTHYHRYNRHGDPEAWKRRKPGTCSVDECDLPIKGSGMCSKHDSRMRRYGVIDFPERPTVCTVDGCDDPVAAKAMCDRHYRRATGRTQGHPSCLWCGSSLGLVVHGSRRFCSKSCREKEHAVRRRENHRDNWLKKYSMTSKDYEAMLKAQDDRCKICRTDKVPARGSFCVDHDHLTGQVRGILCTECNSGLGKFKDNPELLLAAIEYLRRTQRT